MTHGIPDAERLDYYCRDCHHMTESVGGRCAWCRSSCIGAWPLHQAAKRGSSLAPKRPESEEPDVYDQIRYAEKFRLIKGFYIMRGGDI